MTSTAKDNSNISKCLDNDDDSSLLLPTSKAIEIIQSKSKQMLLNLEKEMKEKYSNNGDNNKKEIIQSWIRNEYYDNDTTVLNNNSNIANDKTELNNDNINQCNYPTNRSRYFDINGFLHISSFLNNNEIVSMKNDMKMLVENEWFPDNNDNNNNKTNNNNSDNASVSISNKTSVFRTDEKQIETQGKDNYFLSSSNKVHYFAEKDAIITDDDGNCELKDKYKNNKIMALNKAGHGLHLLPNTSFNKIASSTKFHSLLKNDIGYNHPTIPQSMYIFKQPYIGSEVTSHQDCTFLHTSPRQTCIGFWFALDDANLLNGCLWVRPKSFNEGLRRKFVRNIDYFKKKNGDNGSYDDDVPMLIFQNEPNAKEIPWEGKIPTTTTTDNNTNVIPTSLSYYKYLLKIGFIPIECKAGDIVMFNGKVDHFSLPNYSNTQRHTFQLHLIEGEDSDIFWDDDNWLQYSDDNEDTTASSFMKLY